MEPTYIPAIPSDGLIKLRQIESFEVAVAPIPIPFTHTNTPAITDYQATYQALFGNFPKVRCIVEVDANTRYERQQMPQFTLVDGVIDTIFFDLDDGGETTYSGYIIISK